MIFYPSAPLGGAPAPFGQGRGPEPILLLKDKKQGSGRSRQHQHPTAAGKAAPGDLDVPRFGEGPCGETTTTFVE